MKEVAEKLTDDSARRDACLYLAVLADPSDEERQQRLFDAVDRAAIDWKGCSPKKRDDIAVIVRVQKLVWCHRLPAGQVFAQLFPNAFGPVFGGRLRSADPGPTRAAQRIENELRTNSESQNFLSRPWKNSRPVVHYAYGLLRQEPRPGVLGLVADPTWVTPAIRIAAHAKRVLMDFPLRDANNEILIAGADLIDI